MASLNPKITTKVTTNPADLKNLTVTRTFGVVAPSATSVTVGEVKKFTSYADFVAYAGVDDGLGNTAHVVAKNIFSNVSKAVVYYASSGTQALSATTGTTNAATVVGGTTLSFASAPSFADNDYLSIDTGEKIEYRKVLSGGGTTTITLNKLDFAHASGATITKVTPFAGSLATCRTNLSKKEFEFYIEDSYGNGSDIETFLNTRETERLITLCCLGVDFGTTPASAVTTSQAINNGKMGYHHTAYRDADDGRVYVGVYGASKFISQYAAGRADVAQNNSSDLYKTLFLTPVQGVTEALNPEDFEDYLPSEIATLTDGNVNNAYAKRVGGIQQIVYNRPVTSYYQDTNGNPATTFADFHGYETVWYMNTYFVRALETFIQRNNTKSPPNPITNDKADVFKDRADAELNTYLWFDRTSTNSNGLPVGFSPEAIIDSSVSGTFAIDVDYRFAEVVYTFNYTFNIHNQ